MRFFCRKTYVHKIPRLGGEDLGSQRALRDRLMSRGKTCLPTVSRQVLTRNYPRPNCLLKCLPNCLSPTREGFFFLSSFKINPAVRVIARQVRDKNCLAAIFAPRHQSLVGISAPKKIFSPPPSPHNNSPAPFPSCASSSEPPPPLLLFIKKTAPGHLLGRHLPLPRPGTEKNKKYPKRPPRICLFWPTGFGGGGSADFTFMGAGICLMES